MINPPNTVHAPKTFLSSSPLFPTPTPTPSTMLLLLLLFPLLLAASSPAAATPLGINYGQVANNLPPPSAVVPLLHSAGITRVKLYDADPTVLRCFANSGIDLVLAVPDRCVPKLAAEPNEAVLWVKFNVLPYLPATRISAVTVGNEVLTGNDTSVYPLLLPAMENVHSALTALGLDRQISVTTPHSLAVLSKPSYPPSTASFRPQIAPHLCKILAFLARTGSPLLVNAYPYFAYQEEPDGVTLDYALFQSTSGVVDSKAGVTYTNMLHAQVDAVYTAVTAAVGPDLGKKVVVKVSETGWPSKGDGDEVGATVENAKKYNGNLLRLVEGRKGTPLRPETPLDVYVFALFNENMKPGPASERNYGLFKPDGTAVYDLGLVSGSGSGSGSGGNKSYPTGGGNGGSGNGGGIGGSGDGYDANGYYSFSGAFKEGHTFILGCKVPSLLKLLVLVWTSLVFLRV